MSDTDSTPPAKGGFRQGAMLLLFVCLSFLAPALAAGSPPGDWYATLNKPTWTPPSFLFGPVWTLLYLMIAGSAWLVWRTAGWRAARWVWIAFAVQWVLNAAWTPLFFGLHRPDFALINIVLLDIAVAITLFLAYRIRPLAGLLLAPYLAWISFATALNAALWSLNS